jgi:hypothetical protein
MLIPYRLSKNDRTGDSIHMKKLPLALLMALVPITIEAKEIEIPRSMPEKGRYYLIESSRRGSIISAVHKRVGPSGTGYTKTESNCATGKMRQIGYSEEGVREIRSNPTKWFDLVEGSSKSDLFNFLCNK